MEKIENKQMFPMQFGEDVTWEEGEQYYYLYADRYGSSEQSIERIAERGGFSHEEIEILVKERNE